MLCSLVGILINGATASPSVTIGLECWERSCRWNSRPRLSFPLVNLMSQVRFIGSSCNKTSSCTTRGWRVPAALSLPLRRTHSAARRRGERHKAVSTPYGLDTTCAHPSVTAPINPLTVPTVGCTSSSQPKCGHQQFRRVFPERWMLPSRVRGSNRCGVTLWAKIDGARKLAFLWTLSVKRPDAEVLNRLYSDYH